MFQQLINPVKLEAVTNFYICLAKQNILRTLSFRTQSRNGIIYVRKFVNKYRMRPTFNSLFNVSDSLGIKLLT